MDTIIMSVLLWAAIAAVRGDARVKVWLLYVVAAILIFLLFRHHATDTLPLNF